MVQLKRFTQNIRHRGHAIYRMQYRIHYMGRESSFMRLRRNGEKSSGIVSREKHIRSRRLDCVGTKREASCNSVYDILPVQRCGIIEPNTWYIINFNRNLMVVNESLHCMALFARSFSPFHFPPLSISISSSLSFLAISIFRLLFSCFRLFWMCRLDTYNAQNWLRKQYYFCTQPSQCNNNKDECNIQHAQCTRSDFHGFKFT